MKAKILTIEGEEKASIELPKIFDTEIREDIVARVLEAKKMKQPYAPSLLAGKQHSAKGKLKHLRHVWKSLYGRRISRVPRKILTRKGRQFNWEAAEVPFAKGGMRAHPPKIASMENPAKINKKELKTAFASALSATANKKKIQNKYRTIDKIDKEVPFVVESKLTSLKIKDLVSSLKKILGEALFGVAIKKKSIRAGKGKLRGRKYKTSAGMLIVTGEKEELKTKAFEVKKVKNLSVNDLAKGGLGRLTLYTENAISELAKRFTSSSKSQTKELQEKFGK